MRGKFITLEGIEGSGKTTQLDFIVDYIKKSSIDVVCTREPGGTLVGEKIREILLDNDLPKMHSDTELMLMFAARVEHIKQVIEPALNNGSWVVSDRFYDATYAYQGYGRDISLHRIDQLRSFSVGAIEPDITFLLDVGLDVSMQRVTSRGNKDRFENEKMDFYKKVRDGYLSIAEHNSERVCVIDANQEISDVQLDIQRHLEKLFE